MKKEDDADVDYASSVPARKGKTLGPAGLTSLAEQISRGQADVPAWQPAFPSDRDSDDTNEKRVDAVFRAFKLNYRALWDNLRTDNPLIRSDWQQALAGVDPGSINKALIRILGQKAYPPSVAEFMATVADLTSTSEPEERRAVSEIPPLHVEMPLEDRKAALANLKNDLALETAGESAPETTNVSGEYPMTPPTRMSVIEPANLRALLKRTLKDQPSVTAVRVHRDNEPLPEALSAVLDHYLQDLWGFLATGIECTKLLALRVPEAQALLGRRAGEGTQAELERDLQGLNQVTVNWQQDGEPRQQRIVAGVHLLEGLAILELDDLWFEFMTLGVQSFRSGKDGS